MENKKVALELLKIAKTLSGSVMQKTYKFYDKSSILCCVREKTNFFEKSMSELESMGRSLKTTQGAEIKDLKKIPEVTSAGLLGGVKDVTIGTSGGVLYGEVDVFIKFDEDDSAAVESALKGDGYKKRKD